MQRALIDHKASPSGYDARLNLPPQQFMWLQALGLGIVRPGHLGPQESWGGLGLVVSLTASPQDILW